MVGERAGRWLRVSKTVQEEQLQERDVDAWITSHDYEPVDECTYRLRKSAYKGKHAAMLDKVIEDMQDGKITVLVVWQSARIERRGVASVFDLARRVKQAGGRIEYSAPSDQYLNETNEMSDVMLAFAAAKDHKESQDKSERVRNAQSKIRANKASQGRVTYGYRQPGDKYDKHPVIYEQEAKIVREAKDRYLNGESLQAICDDFNARHVPPPLRTRGIWRPDNLGRLLRNPTIAGRQMSNRDKGERLTIQEFEGIISWREHEQLVARLDSRAHRKGIAPANVFMLTGLIFDEAGHPIYGRLNGNGYSYMCRKGCRFGVPVDEADAIVTGHICEHYGDEPHITRRLVPGENYLDQIAMLRQDIRELDPEGDDEKRDALRAEIQRLRELPARPDRVEWVATGKTIAEHWLSLGSAARHDWLRDHGWRFTACKDKLTGWGLTIDTGRSVTTMEQQLTSLGSPMPTRAEYDEWVRQHNDA